MTYSQPDWTCPCSRLGKSAPALHTLSKDKAGLAVPGRGNNVMRIRSRLVLLACLLPASLWLGSGAGADAPDPHAHMAMPAQAAVSGVHASRWSDPASWPGGKVPGAGEAVTIAKDRNIVLDVSPPALRSLTIEGRLSFSDDKDLELKTEWIYLPGGELDIGSEKNPHTAKATIILTDNVKDENINTMGDRGIMLLNGTLS